MATQVGSFTFQFATSTIDVEAGITDIDCAALYAACKAAQASTEGILYDPIAHGSGLKALGPGVEVGLTIELLGNWQVRFPSGNYIARVAGGNLIGGPGGDPIAYTEGVQILLIQSAAATVVNSTGGSNLTAQEIAAAVLASIQASSVGHNTALIPALL